ncbi:MAG: DUF1853 family protein [Bermanella sp.]
MNQLLTQLSTPRVRHLLWSVLSPDLAYAKSIASLNVSLDGPLREWFISLDQNPSLLNTYLATSKHRLLGIYFESLWQFFLKNAPCWQLKAHNIQIIQDKKTLGELDILAEHIGSQGYHLELAVKFYLQHPSHTGGLCQHWLGPQCRDRLDLKLNKLNNQQFPIINHPQTQAILAQRGISPPASQALILKGYLFSKWQSDFTLPSEVNSACLMGQWLHQKDISELIQPDCHWLLIEKPNWLGPMQIPKDSSNAYLLSGSEAVKTVQKHFLNRLINHALMLIKVIPEQTMFIEKKRYLVVSDSWPNTRD